MAVRHVELVESLTFKLPSRRDGTAVAFPECNLVAGETPVVWIDPVELTGGRWLASVDNVVKDNASLVVDEIDVVTRYVAIALDLTALVGGETVTLGFDLHRPDGPTITGAVVINVTAAPEDAGS